MLRFIYVRPEWSAALENLLSLHHISMAIGLVMVTFSSSPVHRLQQLLLSSHQLRMVRSHWQRYPGSETYLLLAFLS
jgi:hypothetical protein